MKRLLYAFIAVAAFITVYSCGETGTIGTSLLTDQVEIIVDSSYTVTGRSQANTVVLSRTTTQLLGYIQAPEYGTFSSEYVTQFMPAAQIDTTGIKIENIDSLQYIMAVPNASLVGDSVVPMGLEVFLLNKELANPIYSNFDPEGYYDANTPVASEIYNVSAIGKGDTISSMAYRYIYADMPRELGQHLFQSYLDNPKSYLSPEAFTKVFPGIYVRNSFGSGRVARIAMSIMRLFWHRDTIASDGTDSVIPSYGNYYAVTPEIITDNIISYEMSPKLTAMINAGNTIITAPTGSDVEIVFPGAEIVNTYRAGGGPISMINDLEISIPASEISNTYNINPPPYLLMVLAKEKDNFFINNNLPDNETSFYAAYNENTKSYDFTGMRNYVLWLLEKTTISADDYTFLLTPITLNFGTNSSGYYGSSTYLESVAPYVHEPAMTELDLKKAKIIFTYSRQSKK